MAGVSKISLRAKLEDLGIPIELVGHFAGTPAYSQYSYLLQTTTNTDQVLNLGGVATIEAVIILAKDNAISVDTSYVSAFVEELVIEEGEFAVFKPSGIIRLKNHVAGELFTDEVLILGD
jgi:hypothetical protein